MHLPRAHFACRAGFVLLCLLPTAAVAGWIVQRSLPGFVLSQKEEWEQGLSRQLGLRVKCEQVEYPRHDTAYLKNITLRDPETDALVASLGSLEVVYSEQGWKLIGRQAVVETTELPLLRTQFEQRWLRRGAGEWSSRSQCEILIRELTLKGPERSLTLVDVAGLWKPTDAGPECELTFRLPDADPKKPRGRWMVQRNRQTTPPTTHWMVDTGETPLPCALAAPGWPQLHQLGPTAEFAGQLDVQQCGEQIKGKLSGVIQNLELDALVTEQSLHRLTGKALARIENAEFTHQKLSAVRGTIQARDGWVDRSLLAAASEQLQLVAPPPEALGPGTSPLFFRQLSCGFDLRAGTLRLSGHADPLRPHVLIATSAGALLEVPPQHQTSQPGLAAVFRSDLHSAAGIARGHTPTRMGPPRDPQTAPVRQPQLR
jgi:hypothetical protein